MLDDFHPFTQQRRTAPTGYEKVRLTFHGIRTVQLIASIVVGSILIFFIHELIHDHYNAPWTFILLTITSFITILCLTATIIFHFLTGLSPRFNLVLNGIMLFLWALGFAMLTYWSSGTLSTSCTKTTWKEDDGVMVCKCYKALFTFALFGLLSTIAAVGLDMHIHRLAIASGKHTLLNRLDQKPRVVDARDPFADEHEIRQSHDVENYPSRNSDAFEVPQSGYGANNQAKNGLLGPHGYSVPDSQFDYDTGYRGQGDHALGAAR